MSDDDVLLYVYKRLDALEKAGADERVRDSWKNPLFDCLMLPELRGFWPMSSVDEAGGIIDLSRQGRALTINAGAPRGVYANIVPFVDFNGSTQYLSRADEAGLDFAGVMTLGGWFWLDSVAATQRLVTKWNPTGNQRSYALSFISTGVFRFEVSGDGSAVVQVDSSGFTLAANRWYWVVGRCTPSTQIKLFVGDWPLREFANTTGIPSALFDSTAQFRVAVLGDGTGFLDGHATQVWIAATDISDELISQLYMRSRSQFGV